MSAAVCLLYVKRFLPHLWSVRRSRPPPPAARVPVSPGGWHRLRDGEHRVAPSSPPPLSRGGIRPASRSEALPRLWQRRSRLPPRDSAIIYAAAVNNPTTEVESRSRKTDEGEQGRGNAWRTSPLRKTRVLPRTAALDVSPLPDVLLSRILVCLFFTRSLLSGGPLYTDDVR